MKYMVINGKNFEVCKFKGDVSAYDKVRFHQRTDIFDKYAKPSETKIDIWWSWVEWFCDTDGISNFYVASANHNQFTIEASYHDEVGNKYIMYITKLHNRIYKVQV